MNRSLQTPQVPAKYDVFVSFAWTDIDRVRPLVAVLRDEGLSVWFAEDRIGDFASITLAVKEGLLNSKALLAYYSHNYPERRACQWELRTAFVATERAAEPARRIMVINPESSFEHIHPIEIRDAKAVHFALPQGIGPLKALAAIIRRRVAGLDGPFSQNRPAVDSRLARSGEACPVRAI